MSQILQQFDWFSNYALLANPGKTWIVIVSFWLRKRRLPKILIYCLFDLAPGAMSPASPSLSWLLSELGISQHGNLGSNYIRITHPRRDAPATCFLFCRCVESIVFLIQNSVGWEFGLLGCRGANFRFWWAWNNSLLPLEGRIHFGFDSSYFVTLVCCMLWRGESKFVTTEPLMSNPRHEECPIGKENDL